MCVLVLMPLRVESGLLFPNVLRRIEQKWEQEDEAKCVKNDHVIYTSGVFMSGSFDLIVSTFLLNSP